MVCSKRIAASTRSPLNTGEVMILERISWMRSNISSSEEYALSSMPYRRSALGVEPPLWSSAAINPLPDVIRSACCWLGMEPLHSLVALSVTTRRQARIVPDHIHPIRARAARLSVGHRKLALPDYPADTHSTESFTETLRRVADRRRVGSGAYGRRTRHVKQHAHFAEVVPGPGHLDQFLTTVGQFAHDIELTLGHHVDQLAHRALLEQHLAGLELPGFGGPIIRRRAHGRH